MNLNDSKLVTFSCQVCGATGNVRGAKKVKLGSRELYICKRTICFRVFSQKKKELKESLKK